MRRASARLRLSHVLRQQHCIALYWLRQPHCIVLHCIAHKLRVERLSSDQELGVVLEGERVLALHTALKAQVAEMILTARLEPHQANDVAIVCSQLVATPSENSLTKLERIDRRQP